MRGTDSLFFWGVPKIYKIGFAVRAVNWNAITDKNRAKIGRKVNKVARQVRKNHGKVKPGFKTKAWFYAMRMVQSKFGWCAPDVKYWNEMGWTKKVRPWKV